VSCLSSVSQYFAAAAAAYFPCTGSSWRCCSLISYLFQTFFLIPLYRLTFLLVGVENVGIQIEEPFRSLPLDQMCTATLRALLAMKDDREGVVELAARAATEMPGANGGPRAPGGLAHAV
jgi:predicted membrane chloride channel (bestrophin family)